MERRQKLLIAGAAAIAGVAITGGGLAFAEGFAVVGDEDEDEAD